MRFPTLALLAALLTAGCTTADSASETHRVEFQCEGGLRFTTTFTGGTARLEFDGASYDLTQQPTGSGIRYTGEGQELRGRGADMMWTDSAGATHQCRDASAGPAPAGANLLTGTSWRLVHFQSPAGTVVPPSVANYTMEFGADGSLPMQLDCNRANARWSAQASSPNAGTISISPGMMSRAMCQPGAIDTQIAADLARVRSFTIDGGRLSLVLEADAGTYLWEPAS